MNAWRWMTTFAAVGLLVAACGDGSGSTGSDDDDTGSGGTGGAGTSSSSVTPVTGPTTGVGGQTNMGCYREDQALQAPGSMPETGKNDCTSAQIDQFYADCFNSTDPNACSTFQMDMANEACLGCMLGGGGMHYPPLLLGNDQGGSSTVYVNVYACESLAQMQTQCAGPTSQYSHCVNTACETCMSDPEDQACSQEAQGPNGICTANITVPMECEAILGLDLANLSTECAGSDFQSLYTSAANYICGAGGT